MSVNALLGWLNSHPPEQRYEYTNSRNCLICRYFDAIGEEYTNVYVATYDGKDGNSRDLPEHFNNIAVGNAVDRNWTFGDAAQRAKLVLAE
jgi:hypothetical protein